MTHKYLPTSMWYDTDAILDSMIMFNDRVKDKTLLATLVNSVVLDKRNKISNLKKYGVDYEVIRGAYDGDCTLVVTDGMDMEAFTESVALMREEYQRQDYIISTTFVDTDFVRLPRIAATSAYRYAIANHTRSWRNELAMGNPGKLFFCDRSEILEMVTGEELLKLPIPIVVIRSDAPKFKWYYADLNQFNAGEKYPIAVVLGPLTNEGIDKIVCDIELGVYDLKAVGIGISKFIYICEAYIEFWRKTGTAAIPFTI